MATGSRTRRQAADRALAPVDRQPLGRIVAQRVIELIRAEQMESGAKLPSERELMERLGVGRSSVREALNGLSLMGIVDVRHGQGAFVVSPVEGVGAENLGRALRRGVTVDLLEARETLELSTVARAARRATEEDLRELRQSVEGAERCLSTQAPLAPLSARFHVLIAQASHNQILQEMVGMLSGSLEERGPALEGLPGYREWEVSEHRGLLNAVAARDENLAVERMRRHLTAMAEHLRRVE